MGLKRKLIGLVGIVAAPATGGASLLLTGGAVITRDTKTKEVLRPGATRTEQTASALKQLAQGDRKGKPTPDFEVTTSRVKDMVMDHAQAKAAREIVDRAYDGWEVVSQSESTGGAVGSAANNDPYHVQAATPTLADSIDQPLRRLSIDAQASP